MNLITKTPPIGTKVFIQFDGFKKCELEIRGRIMPQKSWRGKRGSWESFVSGGESDQEYNEYKQTMNWYAKNGKMYV